MSGRYWSHLLRAALDANACGGAPPAAGTVVDLRVASGEVLARVAVGGRVHRVSLILSVLEPPQWDTVAAALGGQPLFRARLLAGRLPAEVARVFDVLGLPLLPRGPAEPVVTCSCPEWGGVCGHAAAVLDALAGRVDADPFLLTAWRGCDRGALLAAVRAHARAGREAVGDADAAPPVRVAARPLPEDPDEFWRAPALPAPPARAEPPPPLPADGPLAALAPLYERLRRG